MKIRISGASDDLIEIEGDVTDEFSAYNAGEDLHHGAVRVATIGGATGVLVHLIYDGTWSCALGQLEEGRSLPAWGYTIGQQHEYSTYLEIDTGDELVEVLKMEQMKGVWKPVKKRGND